MEMKQYLEFCAMYAPIKSPAAFRLKYSRAFTIDPRTFVVGKAGKPQQCYMNAAKLALRRDDLIYVEGHVCIHGIPIEHAWNVRPDGTVVDVTLRGDVSRVSDYYGVPISTAYLNVYALHSKVWGVLCWQGEHAYLDADPNEVVAMEFLKLEEAA